MSISIIKALSININIKSKVLIFIESDFLQYTQSIFYHKIILRIFQLFPY